MNPAAVLSVLVKDVGTDQTRKNVQGLDKDLDKAGKTGSKTGSILKKAGGVVGGVVGFTALAGGVKFAIGEFEEARKVGAQTTQVIKTTGGAANVTAKQVSNLAGAISKKTGIDDEAIQSGANLLLTFTNIRNEAGKGNKIFDQSTQIITDMSAALGTDMKQSAIQVGKALNDPVKGVSALARVGVSFTEQQKAQIKTLVESGDTLKAQKVILGELQKEFGGTAQAKATALDKLKVSVGNLAEAAGAVLVPMLDKAATFLSALINQMIEGKSTGGALISVFKSTGSVIGDVVGALSDLIGWFKQHETVSLALGAAIGTLLVAFAGFQILAGVQAAIVALKGAMLALNASFLTNPVFLVVAALAALAAGVVVAYRESETFRDIVDGAWKVIKDVAGWLITAGVDAFEAVRDAVKGAWNVIDDVTRTVWNGIKGFLKNVIWEPIKGAVEFYFGAYKSIITAIWRGPGSIKDITENVWGGIKGFLGDIWDKIKGTADTSWSAIKGAVLDPIRSARDLLKDEIWPKIKSIGENAWDAIKDGFDKGGEKILNVLTWPFRQAVKGIVKFTNMIIGVVNKIPGVDIGKIEMPEGLAKGGQFGGSRSDAAQGFAHGGAFARTGGLVNSPITLMGEEAPRHPEFVIPTNPAYRGRARDLLAQAAGAIGFATGGRWSIPELEGLWKRNSAIDHMSRTMAIISTAESGVAGQYGNQYARNPSGASGLWQILGQEIPGDIFNADVNAKNADWKLRNQGLGAWAASESVWRPLLGKSSSVLNSAISALNPMDLIKKLPGVDMLPGWLSGLGGHVLDKVKDYIKDQLIGGISSIGGGSPGWSVIDALARSYGLDITSTFRGGSGSLHNLRAGAGRARATDYSNGTSPTKEMMGFAREVIAKYGSRLAEVFYSPLGGSIDNGQWHPGMIIGGPLGTPGNHYNHVHVGFAKGGVYGGLLGSYARGTSFVPQTGPYLLHRGERVIDAQSNASGERTLYAEIDLGRGIKQRIKLEFDEQGRQKSGTWNAGVLS